MTFATYLLYLAAVLLLVVTPGPTMLMCMTRALHHGPRAALISVAGSVSAVLCVMLLSALGLGALLATSDTAFLVAKSLGAAYLIWLGIRTLRSPPPALLAHMAARPSRRSSFLQDFLVGASNPKAVLFFAAFFPQFVEPAAPLLPQLALLALGFVLLEFGVLTACALGVARLAPWLARSGPARWINRVCGGLFALMGTLLLFARRSG